MLETCAHTHTITSLYMLLDLKFQTQLKTTSPGVGLGRSLLAFRLHFKFHEDVGN